MSTAILTGASGFVGRWLVNELLKSGDDVVAVVRPGRGGVFSWIAGNSRLKILECSMEKYSGLPELLGKCDGSIFYNLAWAGVSGIDRTDMEVQFSNIQASAAAIEAAAAIGCSRFVGIGTIMEAEARAVVDLDRASPSAAYIYGEAKQFTHLQTKIAASQYGVEHIWAVLTNAYGEYENSPRFINTTLRKIIHNEPLKFTTGMQLYDFIHVEDAVRALIAAAKLGIPNSSYIIGSGQAAPLRQFVETIGRTLAPKQKLLFGSVPYTGAQLERNAFSIEKIVQTTGWQPQISFEAGITRTMNWLRKTEMQNE